LQMRSSLQAVRLLAKCSELNVQLPEMESLEKVNVYEVSTPQSHVFVQLVKQLQWLQKAESVLKAEDDCSSTSHTLRFISDMLKEGHEMADNKCTVVVLLTQ